VICSPAAARSRWVGEEVLTFKRLNGETRILALIADGEPFASLTPGGEAQECFPLALRFHIGSDGALSHRRAEPNAADIRANKDGRRVAKLKLVAGLAGIRLDDLVQRETQRRTRRLVALSGASLTGMVFAGGLAIYADTQRIEAEKQRAIAERESASARAASDYLIGTYQLINPATENPRSISALTLLARGADRARIELADQPVIHARILQALGQAYNNLGLQRELVGEISRSLPAVRRAGPDGVGALIQLASAYDSLGKSKEAMNAIALAQRALGPPAKANPLLVADVDTEQARLFYSGGDLKRGLASLDAALKLYRSIRTLPPAKLASALHTRGLLLSDDGQFAAADAALSESLRIYRRSVGDRHLSTANAWYALALNSLAAGALGPARTDIENALAIDRIVLDGDNPRLADAYSMEGQILEGEHQADAAASALQTAIAIFHRAFGAAHPQTGIAYQYLAKVESDRGHLALALEDIDEAKHNYDLGYGRIHPNHGDLLVWRAEILAKAGRRPEAVADCAAGIKILDQTLGADASFTRSDASLCARL
jgi:hypothetical protein